MSQTQRRPVVFLHIGPMKTGTSYVQNLMAANRERLQTAGHLFPGGSWDRQVRGVQDVLRRTRHDPQVRAAAQGAWAALAREVLEYDGHASIVSVEFLSFAGRAGVSRVLRSLDAAEVHVVLTVRDVTAIIPSRWPTEVHNGSTVSWPAYTRALRTGAMSGRQGRCPRSPRSAASARRRTSRGSFASGVTACPRTISTSSRFRHHQRIVAYSGGGSPPRWA